VTKVDGSRIFIVQYSSIGGPKFGFEDDPEGVWVDHEVFGDRADAEAEARTLEEAGLVDAGGKDITGVVRIVRVITLDEYGREVSSKRLGRFLTSERSRLAELVR
jgi:hypothetical protein